MLVNSFPQTYATEISKIHKYATAILQRLFQSNFDIVLFIMVAHNLGTQIKGLYKLVSVTKGYLFVSSTLSLEPIRALFLETTRGLRAPQTLATLTTTSTAPQNNFLEQVLFPKL